MTAAIADIPPPARDHQIELTPEPDASWLAALTSAARALYLRSGFRDSHRYHYLIAP